MVGDSAPELFFGLGTGSGSGRVTGDEKAGEAGGREEADKETRLVVDDAYVVAFEVEWLFALVGGIGVL